MFRSGSGIFAAAAGVILSAALAANVAAQAATATITQNGPVPDDPLMDLADRMTMRNQFVLTSQADVDLVRFRQPHVISICVPHVKPGNLADASHAVGVIVSWDGDTQTVAPGSCFMLDARKLSVRPAGPLGGNITLSGNIRVLR